MAFLLHKGEFVVFEDQAVAGVDAEGQKRNCNFGYNARIFVFYIGIIAPNINDSTVHSFSV